AKVVGAIFSGSADLLSEEGKKLPGQLSLTVSEVAWVPNHYSEVRGAKGWSVAVGDGLKLSLQRGPGLLDLVLTVGTAGNERRFLAHQSRRLRRAVERLAG
ncbi:MAG TPA: hypothetical protein VGR71_15780, partial [Nitrospira sp.]|nr:hypothetical protein [Nitrospira sp.]